MADEGAPVRSGEFQVERALLLEKVAQFRHKDPREFLLAWIRGAVAAGATRIDLRWFWEGGFELSYDGKTLTKAELGDVYAPLFGGKEDPHRYFLSAGLVGALRRSPKSVGIGSGQGRTCPQVLATSLTEDTLQETSIPDGGTVITVLGLDLPPASARALLRERCSDCAVPISVDGKRVNDRTPAEDDACVELKQAGTRIRLRPAFDAKGKSRLSVAVCGVSVEALELDLGAVVASGTLSDDRLALDASHAKVTASPRLESAQALAREAGKALFSKLLETHRRALREAGKLLAAQPALVRVWDRELSARSPGSRASNALARMTLAVSGLLRRLGPRPEGGWEERIAETAGRTAWLRETAHRGTQGWEARRGSAHERYRPFWIAPVFLDWRARPLSLLELREGCDGSGVVWYSRRFHGGPPLGEPVVWAASAGDLAALKRCFPSVRFEDLTWKAQAA